MMKIKRETKEVNNLSDLDDLKTLSSIYSYNFNSNMINKILERLDKFISENKNDFDKSIEIDNEKNNVKIELDKLINIIKENKNNSEFFPVFTAKKIVDGYGNICVLYNGNPYITLKLIINALRTHNNIVFCTDNFLHINGLLIEGINIVVKELKYAEKIALLQTNISETNLNIGQKYFNLVLYIGNKISFKNVQKLFNVPSICIEYGYINVFIEDDSFKDILLDIDKYAYKNSISINYFDNTDIEETIEHVNQYNLNDYFVIFTKNPEIAYKLVSSIKAKNILINANPFENYEFYINEDKLVYTKNIKSNV